MKDKFFLHNALAFSTCVCVAGCISMRHATMVDVPDIGDKITTKYRYYCVGTSHDDFRRWLEEGKEDIGCPFLRGSSLDAQNRRGLSKFQPNVFSDGGIPIVLVRRTIASDRWGNSEASQLGWFVFYMCTAGLLPFHPHGSEEESQILVTIADERLVEKQISVKTRSDEIVSMLTPSAFLFYHGKPTFDGHEKSKVFSKTVCRIGAGPCYTGDEALAYGLAAKLKELEDSGMITEATMQRAAVFHQRHNTAKRNSFLKKVLNQSSLVVNTPAQRVDVGRNSTANIRSTQMIVQASDAYTLERFVWDSDRDYACSFAVKMKGECTIEAFFSVENKFREYISGAFIQSHPSVDRRFLVVDVRPSLDSGRIIGRAAVLTIEPISITYDAYTRQGKISVRFASGQYEEARAWARKNIETLARDKNISLVTGRPPPDARYYSLGETVKDGNILEIEFKTE